MSENISELSIRDLLDGSKDQYVIPMYQRNYAWDEGEITQLIQDILDYLPQGDDKPCNYYIGSLVVFERGVAQPGIFEVIDGQQRLTTLSLLAAYIKNSGSVAVEWFNSLNIYFDSRENSRATFETIFQRQFNSDPSELLTTSQINPNILNGYRLIQKILLQKLNKEYKVEMEHFASFLFKFVKILRVKVPKDTDLNHYFEIMNNRGEQLEKHEVLKARLMEKLKDCKKSEACLHVVWEACANMERYVQMGFTPAQRNNVFDKNDKGNFLPENFDQLAEALQQEHASSGQTQLDNQNVKQTTSYTLDQIISSSPVAGKLNSSLDDSPERFNTVINFSNFLLHVLRVQTEKDVALDDKRLLDSFDEHVLSQHCSVNDVKTFIYNLLRCKYLFDKYIIKREFINGEDGWSLKRLEWYAGGDRSPAGRGNYVNTFGEKDANDGINRKILMLLSAFHVSTPTLVFKYWLNAALYYLFNTKEFSGKDYCDYLESVAKSFIFDRFLSSEKKYEYHEIIYEHKGRCQVKRGNLSEEKIEPSLRFGSIENNLIFNFLDYLLWCEDCDSEPMKFHKFTFRSSVEHYYPQTPRPGLEILDQHCLNSFGNLCLISHEKNSILSNREPKEKKAFYLNNSYDSLKQYLMMQKETWDSKAIQEHGQAMMVVLLNSLNDQPAQGTEDQMKD